MVLLYILTFELGTPTCTLTFDNLGPLVAMPIQRLYAKSPMVPAFAFMASPPVNPHFSKVFRITQILPPLIRHGSSVLPYTQESSKTKIPAGLAK
jgi:hypothetical protein